MNAGSRRGVACPPLQRVLAEAGPQLLPSPPAAKSFSGWEGDPRELASNQPPIPFNGDRPGSMQDSPGAAAGQERAHSRPAQQWLKEGGPASLGWGTGWGACVCACACPVTSLARLGPGRAGPGAGRRPSPWGWAALGRAAPWRLACCGPQRCGGRARRGSCPSSWPEPAWSG